MIGAVPRRVFLKSVVAAGASGTVVGAPVANAAVPPDHPDKPSPKPSAVRPNAQVAAAEAGQVPTASAEESRVPASDFMVDVLKSLNFDYLLTNPASSFRSLHESLINYGGNKMPEMLTCLHEESAVGMAHGYFQDRRKALACSCSRYRRLATRLHGDLQCLVRSRSGDHLRWQSSRRGDTSARCADLSRSAGSQRDHSRLHEMG